MRFYESVCKFIFRMNDICFLTDPTFAIIFRGIISEPRKKRTIHSEEAPVNYPSVSNSF
jgi:hypothetical protein